ncbi:MAG: hypothetical protein DMG32_07090 [Acidobacteria bacterium]|nr:MAG: hypothetical protein DMG32_07090 [Acidobacteriota bacterium]
MISNKDRDLTAFARIKPGANGDPGPIEVLAARADAEVDWFTINEQGSLAAVAWNVGGKDELTLTELPSGKTIE